MLDLSFLRRREKEYEEIRPETPSRIVKVDKKKKFPPKPWGKKERFLVALFFFGLILASLAFSISGGGFKTPKLKGISDVVFPQQKIIIEVDEGRQQALEAAKKEFQEATSKLKGVWGFSVYSLARKSGFGYKEEEQFQAASLMKLAVMVALFKASEEGRLDLETKYKLAEGDKVGGAGSLYLAESGSVYTYRDLARLSGKQSDNTAFSVLRAVLGDETVERTISDLGMKKTSLGENLTTPKDIQVLLRSVYLGEYIGEESAQELLSFITDTQFDDRMPKGVPEGVRVSHKIGNEVGIVADAGIIYGPNPFVLVIMNKGVNEEEAKENFAGLVKIFWKAEEN